MFDSLTAFRLISSLQRKICPLRTLLDICHCIARRIFYNSHIHFSWVLQYISYFFSSHTFKLKLIFFVLISKSNTGSIKALITTLIRTLFFTYYTKWSFFRFRRHNEFHDYTSYPLFLSAHSPHFPLHWSLQVKQYPVSKKLGLITYFIVYPSIFILCWYFLE